MPNLQLSGVFKTNAVDLFFVETVFVSELLCIQLSSSGVLVFKWGHRKNRSIYKKGSAWYTCTMLNYVHWLLPQGHHKITMYILKANYTPSVDCLWDKAHNIEFQIDLFRVWTVNVIFSPLLSSDGMPLWNKHVNVERIQFFSYVVIVDQYFIYI